jgi:hypothetical protein
LGARAQHKRLETRRRPNPARTWASTTFLGRLRPRASRASSAPDRGDALGHQQQQGDGPVGQSRDGSRRDAIPPRASSRGLGMPVRDHRDRRGVALVTLIRKRPSGATSYCCRYPIAGVPPNAIRGWKRAVGRPGWPRKRPHVDLPAPRFVGPVRDPVPVWRIQEVALDRRPSAAPTCRKTSWEIGWYTAATGRLATSSSRLLSPAMPAGAPRRRPRSRASDRDRRCPPGTG